MVSVKAFLSQIRLCCGHPRVLRQRGQAAAVRNWLGALDPQGMGCICADSSSPASWLQGLGAKGGVMGFAASPAQRITRACFGGYSAACFPGACEQRGSEAAGRKCSVFGLAGRTEAQSGERGWCCEVGPKMRHCPNLLDWDQVLCASVFPVVLKGLPLMFLNHRKCVHCVSFIVRALPSKPS